MANKRISELAAAAALTGAEAVEAVQGGVNVQTTTQAIANLAPSTPGAEAFLDLTDVPASYSGEANKVVSVKADESGLEFTTASGTVTAGSGLSESGGVIRLGTTGSQVVTTDVVLDPTTANTRYFSIGDTNAYDEIILKGRSVKLQSSGDFANARRVTLSTYGGASSRFATIGVYNNISDLTGPAIDLIDESATNNVVEILHLRRNVGNGAIPSTAGVGAKINFQINNDTAFAYSPKAGLSYILTDVTNGSEDSKYVFSVLVNGVETTSFEITGDGIVMGGKKITGLGAATSNGDAVRYDQVVGVQDLYIPASAMWPRTTGGCAALAKSEMSTSLLNIQTLDFDQTTQEFAQFTIALPRKYNNGTVTAVVYWTASSGSGDVQWGISGGAYSNDDALTVAFGTAQTVDDTLLATNDLHITPATSAITLAGTPADADFLAFQISRNPASDTLSGDAKLLGISLRITTDAAIDA